MKISTHRMCVKHLFEQLQHFLESNVYFYPDMWNSIQKPEEWKTIPANNRKAIAKEAIDLVIKNKLANYYRYDGDKYLISRIYQEPNNVLYFQPD